MRRMDRYKDLKKETLISRKNKNEDLYNEINKDIKFANITDVSNTNIYDIGSSLDKENTTREDYHKIKEFKDLDIIPKNNRELNDIKILEAKKEKKVYDINKVLEDARNSRDDLELEKKRKLTNTNYNILAGLNKEEVERYILEKNKKAKDTSIDDKDVRELIDTITTKTLIGDISKETSVNLLSDLMATKSLDVVAAQLENTAKIALTQTNILKESNDKLLKNEMDEVLVKANDKNNNNDGIDRDFFTKSMDLSDEDFSFKNEFKEKEGNLFIKVLIFIILLIIIVIASIYVYINYFK